MCRERGSIEDLRVVTMYKATADFAYIHPDVHARGSSSNDQHSTVPVQLRISVVVAVNYCA